jgi:hypothetical protein
MPAEAGEAKLNKQQVPEAAAFFDGGHGRVALANKERLRGNPSTLNKKKLVTDVQSTLKNLKDVTLTSEQRQKLNTINQKFPTLATSLNVVKNIKNIIRENLAKSVEENRVIDKKSILERTNSFDK